MKRASKRAGRNVDSGICRAICGKNEDEEKWRIAGRRAVSVFVRSKREGRPRSRKSMAGRGIGSGLGSSGVEVERLR